MRRSAHLLFVVLCSQCGTMPVRAFHMASAGASRIPAPRSPPAQCLARKLQTGEVIGYALLLNFFTPPVVVFLTQRGLITPPPFNTFTAIANNAMEEAIGNGDIDKLMGTVCKSPPLDPRVIRNGDHHRCDLCPCHRWSAKVVCLPRGVLLKWRDYQVHDSSRWAL